MACLFSKNVITLTIWENFCVSNNFIEYSLANNCVDVFDWVHFYYKQIFSVSQRHCYCVIHDVSPSQTSLTSRVSFHVNICPETFFHCCRTNFFGKKQTKNSFLVSSFYSKNFFSFTAFTIVHTKSKERLSGIKGIFPVTSQ